MAARSNRWNSTLQKGVVWVRGSREATKFSKWNSFSTVSRLKPEIQDSPFHLKMVVSMLTD